ncbi:MAG: hypothetical protein J1F39_02770 [Clostridiales bacterium]|nr:hypothetical protein [Clostridiales bacterium]
MDSDEILSAVVKRARGYIAMETVEEYAVVDGSLELVKKRVTTKDVPPDMTAAKMLFDDSDFSSMTDEMLEAERRRLLLELERESKTDDAPKDGKDSEAANDTTVENGPDTAKDKGGSETSKKTRTKNPKGREYEGN